jgi:hypothetical protein
MRGSMKQRAKGSWTLRVDIGTDPVTGKRKQKVKTSGAPERTPRLSSAAWSARLRAVATSRPTA